MVTGREINKISQTLTDGQPAPIAPTTKRMAYTSNLALRAEGENIQEAAPCILKKMVRKFFMAYMHELVHICHLGCRFFVDLRYASSYHANFIFGTAIYASTFEMR